MKRSTRRVAALALLGFLLAIGVPTAQAGRVNFEKETHFRCYTISKQTPQPAQTVTLSDQFLQDVTLTIDEPLQFCAPTSKNGLPILAPEEHLTMYGAAHELTPHLQVFTEDQFGPRTLEAVGARVLLVPTQKLVGELGFPTKLNHFWCYDVSGPPVDQQVTLADQFGSDTVTVTDPEYFCNPVEKTHGTQFFRIIEKEVHLTCYDIKGPQRTESIKAPILNQFERDTFTITSWDILCVPAEKISFSPVS